MNNQELLFAKTHEWVQFLDGDSARLGISDFAQKELGDLVFINLPEKGDAVTKGQPFSDVESVKAVSNVYSPVTGVIRAVNDKLFDHPELVNSDPYDAWFVEVEDITDRGELMSEEEYLQFIKEGN